MITLDLDTKNNNILVLDTKNDNILVLDTKNDNSRFGYQKWWYI